MLLLPWATLPPSPPRIDPGGVTIDISGGWVGLLTAIGTLAAAIVPLTLYLIERHERLAAQRALHDLEERQRNELAEAKLRSQADQVHAYSTGRELVLLNASDLPAYDVRVNLVFQLWTGANMMDWAFMIFPGVLLPNSAKGGTVVDLTDTLKMINDGPWSPGQQWAFEHITYWRAHVDYIWFADSARQQWKREVGEWVPQAAEHRGTYEPPGPSEGC